jgi:hypothetical protein
VKIKIGENAWPAQGKRVHHSVYRPIGNRHTLLCNSAFNLGIDGWIRNWLPTKRPVTCEHCLRRRKYYENLSRFEEDQTSRS